MNIGTYLQRARKRKNLSQEEAAIKLNVTRQCVSLWENDQTAPTLENLESLSNLYGLTISILVGQTPFPEDNESRNEAAEKKKEEQRIQKEKAETDLAIRLRSVGTIIGLCSTLLFLIPLIGTAAPLLSGSFSVASYRKLKDFRSLSFIIISIVYAIASVIVVSTDAFWNLF